ncbi:hypothetical protein Tco_0071211 [Tanacetum coccineum]
MPQSSLSYTTPRLLPLCLEVTCFLLPNLYPNRHHPQCQHKLQASPSSAIVPATSEPQTPAKIDPLDALNAFTRQPTGAPVQSAGPSLPRPNQQARLKIQKEHKFPTHHCTPLPKKTRAVYNKYMKSVHGDLTPEREMGKSLVLSGSGAFLCLILRCDYKRLCDLLFLVK